MRSHAVDNKSKNKDYYPPHLLHDKQSNGQAFREDDEDEDVFEDAKSELPDGEYLADIPPSRWGRAVLPAPMFSRSDYSVWSILKHCIGKELSKITMPVIFNEPLSLLQRFTETMEYCDLLKEANECDDPVKRIEYVAAFAVAKVSYNSDRITKSFNPLLGETYELTRDDLGLNIVFEQVSHHPPISAFHAESPDFIFCGTVRPKLHFNIVGRSVDIKPEGVLTVQLKRYSEVYTWSAVECCIRNIIVGKLWIEQCGMLNVKCHSNGYTAALNFKPAGWFSRDSNHVEGYIYDSQQQKIRFLYGKWCSYMKSCDISYAKDYSVASKHMKSSSEPDVQVASKMKRSPLYTAMERSETSATNSSLLSLEDIPSDLLWKVQPRPTYSARYFNFSLFTMALNELRDGMNEYLPQTDSRFRPDVKKLEEGDVDAAAYEKNRLEEKQRAVRNQRKKQRTEWKPLWFENKKHTYTQEDTWVYKGNYWNRNYENCPDIY